MRFNDFISSIQRDELPRMAVREAIVNAVCHRDYESNGAVQVMLFRDRLEIMNPGTLPRGWTAETLLTTHESIARNKVIAKALDWAGYVERSGHGTEFIIERCEAQGLATPQYKPDTAIFHTIIWRAAAGAEVAHQVAYDVAHQAAQSNGSVVAQSAISQRGQSERAGMGGVAGGVVGGVEDETPTIHEKVFDFISKREMSNAEIARELGWSRVYGGLARVIKNLLSDGIIEYTIPEKPRSRLQKYRLTEKGRQMLSQKGKHK